MSNKAGFKVILGIGFIVLAAVIVSYFLADFLFNSAQKSESEYLWQKADGEYCLATKLDPFSAKYLAGYADFLRAKSFYQKDKIGWLEKAGKLYARALELDPRNAEYALSTGEVELNLFSLDKDKFKNSLSRGLSLLKRAIENDPNDIDIKYTAVYDAMSVGVDLNSGKKEESLSQYWQGRSRDGDIYEHGNMYWTGTVRRLADIPTGMAILKIQAKGSPADDIWPYMIVELDGMEIGEGFVDSLEWKGYSFRIDTNGGMKVLSITFTNDGVDPQRNEDRNLFVGDIRVEKP